MAEHPGDVTFQGAPLTRVGEKLEAGDKAPDFHLLASDLSEVTLADSAGKVRVIIAVPSLDTGVCDAEARRFDEEIAGLGDGVVGIAVSADLPSAQARWCSAADVATIQTLSDHRDMAFGEAYGALIKELRLNSRSVFVVDRDGVVRYTEYVKEITEHPNYDAALAAVKEALG